MITTSDHNEGWGAVINEGMSSGCAVVASHLMGATPFLIKNNQNGCIFESGNIDDLYDKTKTLLENPTKCESISKNAYETIVYTWNGQQAAERLSEVCRKYMTGNIKFAFESDVCSYAERLSNNWIKR